MRTKQWHWRAGQGWPVIDAGAQPPTVVFLFGGRAALEESDAIATLAAHLPRERFFGCSTGGEIEGANVHDDTVVATALWLDQSSMVSTSARLSEAHDATALGKLLAQRLTTPDLKHAFVLSDGLKVNGSELARGLVAGLPPKVSLTGGLSGDGPDMKRTVVVHAGQVLDDCISVLGFSGAITIGTGSLGGWDSFGPPRRVTKSRGNVLEELDGEPALALYKRYLGKQAEGLPSSALLFPLMVQTGDGSAPVVRTILGIDETTGTMTFAGDVTVGSSAQLMRANFERIIEAGEGAATASLGSGATPGFALLVSCVGRKWILKQRVEEEVEAVRSVLGPSVTTTGFYSYGELAPNTTDAPCQLHNQTMTVTTFMEG